MEYTKGPWKVGKPTDALGYETPIYADTDEGRKYEIATVHIYNGEQKANAERIVKAVNCHDDLYEALKSFDRYLSASYPDNMKYKAYAVEQMEKALSRAEGK